MANSFYFVYGNYTHEANECTVTYSGARTIYNDRGAAVVLRKRMVVEGEIIGGSPSAIAERVDELRLAYSLDGREAALYDDVGLILSLSNLGSTTGVRIVEKPAFLAQDGRAHYVTGLPFRIVFEADYPVLFDGIVEYTETIAQIGTGGSRRVCLELDTGAPVIQTVSSATPVVVVQQGSITGFSGYLTVNAPVFPNAILAPEDRQIVATSPRRQGLLYTDFNYKWMYRMTLDTPLPVSYPQTR